MLLALVIISGAFLQTPRSSQDSAVLVLSDCPPNMPACVTMSIDAPALGYPLPDNPNEDASGWTPFHLTVRGQLRNIPTADVAITVRGYTAGMACSGFGQARAAVIEFTPEHYPIILTTQGPFAVADTALRVGCPTCALIISSSGADTLASMTTPGWDLSLAGHRFDALSYDDAGSLYLSVRESCIRMPRDDAFEVVDPDRCLTMEEVGNAEKQPPGFTLEPGERLFHAAGREYLMGLYAGACT